jgi:hypothetical protein
VTDEDIHCLEELADRQRKHAVQVVVFFEKHYKAPPLPERAVPMVDRMLALLEEELAVLNAVIAGEQPDTRELRRLLALPPTWMEARSPTQVAHAGPLGLRNPEATPRPVRACEVCGESLDERRVDATVCGAPCRRERSRVRTLSAGRGDAGYQTLAEYANRRQRRAKRAGAA